MPWRMQVPHRASSGADSHRDAEGAGGCRAAAVPEALRGVQIQLQPHKSAVGHPHILTHQGYFIASCLDSEGPRTAQKAVTGPQLRRQLALHAAVGQLMRRHAKKPHVCISRHAHGAAHSLRERAYV